MPVDTSIYAIQPKPYNPLETAGQLIGVKNALVQNQLSQQELQARTGLGQVYQGSIGPNGQFDPTLLNKGVQSGAAGYMAGPALTTGAGVNSTNVSTQGAQLQQQGERLNGFYNALGPSVQSNIGYRDVVKMAAERLAHGLITPQDFTAITQEAPTDPKALKAWATNRYESTLPASTAIAPTNMGPNSEGAPTTGTGVQFFNKTTSNPAAAAPAKQGTAAAPTGGITSGLSTTQNASLDQLAKDRVTATNYRQSAYPLEQAIKGLDTLGATGTGPGSEAWNDGIAALRNLGVPIPQGTSDKNIAFSETKKYLVQNVLQNADTGTNEKLLTAITGNPNMTLPQAAVSSLAKVALGLRRMNAAKTLEFDREGRPGANYTKWSEQWATNQDPRAFAFDEMDGPAQQKLIQSLGKPSSPAYKKFMGSLRSAYQNNLLSEPAGNAQ